MKKTTIRQLIFWLAGFAILFLFNLFVEYFVLTWLDLHNTTANDPYFISWWLLVLVWLIFGWKMVGSMFKEH
jgi:hypothetical protein